MPRVSVDRCVLGGAFPEGFLWGVATSSFQVEMGRGSDADGSDSPTSSKGATGSGSTTT